MKTIAIPQGMETTLFVMDSGALRDIPEALTTTFPGKRPWIIADENTWKAAGQQVMELFHKAAMSPFEPFIFPGHPILHASEEISQHLASVMPEGCVPVAVGSGTVNDLTKRASGLRKVHYCCVPTACSVDGYTSRGAALLVGGLKKTMPCPAPFAVVADTDILATAPAPMMAAGYADLLAKIYGGADWMIVDELGIEPIDPVVWPLVQEHLREWLADCHNLGNLFHGLCNTGYSMQLYNDSRPASGAEHLFSHVWEMEKFMFNGDTVSHGFQVGIGMLLSCQLMEFLIHHDVEAAMQMARPAENYAERKASIAQIMKKNCYGNAEETAWGKFLDGEAQITRRKLIFSHWETLRQRVKQQYIPYDELVARLQTAGCPAKRQDIGMSKEQFLNTVRTAQLIRKRYTILDLLYEAGLLESAIASIQAD